MLPEAARASSGVALPPSAGGLSHGLHSTVLSGLHMPWRPTSEEGKREASVPGEAGTRAETAGAEIPPVSAVPVGLQFQNTAASP